MSKTIGKSFTTKSKTWLIQNDTLTCTNIVWTSTIKIVIKVTGFRNTNQSQNRKKQPLANRII